MNDPPVNYGNADRPHSSGKTIGLGRHSMSELVMSNMEHRAERIRADPERGSGGWCDVVLSGVDNS